MKYTALRIRLATSQLIRKWARREFINGQKKLIISGQILNPETVEYETLKPEKNGLFCERIFGPINDSLCACGLPPLQGEKFCANCEVEFTSSRVRRYRVGYIQLVTAAAHVWFFKGRPNYFALFLNLPNSKIESLLYCTRNICRTIFPKEFEFLEAPRRRRAMETDRQTQASQTMTRSGWPSAKERASSPSVGAALAGLSQTPETALKQIKGMELKSIRFWGVRKVCRYFLAPELPILNVISRDCGVWPNPRLGLGLASLTLVREGGGLRDSALYFGFALISKMLSWGGVMGTLRASAPWFDFVYFGIQSPRKGDLLNKYYPGPPSLVNFCPPQSKLYCLTGVQLIKTWLSQLTQNFENRGLEESRFLEIQLRIDLLELDTKEPLLENEFIYKINILRRFKYLRSFRHKKMNPASMILCVLPVLPPDLRPIVRLDSNQIAVSDLNKLYQNVLFRNKRLFQLTKVTDFHCLNSEPFQYAQRLLQESVDNLIDNRSGNGGPSRLKSLSDLFKGKKGRFRQNLLGKRVDYSGRSVIVVGPYLKIYECGIPKGIAYELFQPFLIRSLMLQKKAHTIIRAKKLLNTKSSFIWNLLKKIVEKHGLLLNRAPTLHRLSIQAFLPRLIEGQAILLHPLVCSAFNADFDGDQMGVHIPLCLEARGEAWKILWSQNHLFSVATGNPVCVPSQDMILGSCFLTTANIRQYCISVLKNQSRRSALLPLRGALELPEREGARFFPFGELWGLSALPRVQASQGGPAKPWAPYWISQNPIESLFETQKKKQKLIEIRINLFGQSQKIRSQFCQYYHSSGTQILRSIRTTYGRLKFHRNLL
uniref:DNA-directed RNA polymerase subunit n=1 Tax=Caulerpa cliftonii TaxID=1004391 RepID=A0A1C9JBJ8_9CHLO|nr:RNA polymerase b1-subunit [Caulerpa cliftonii]AOP19230.1 RNA polymerase b1-subunit [Caulerpa cliftonii]